MARNTQRDVIADKTTILAVNVSPLNETGTGINLATLTALRRFTEPAHKPLVQTPIANTISLPSIVSSTSRLVLSNRLLAFLESISFSILSKFRVAYYRIAFSTTEIARLYMGWTLGERFGAIVAVYFSHTPYYRSNNGEMQLI
jgi:hypothetical protein